MEESYQGHDIDFTELPAKNNTGQNVFNGFKINYIVKSIWTPDIDHFRNLISSNLYSQNRNRLYPICFSILECKDHRFNDFNGLVPLSKAPDR